MARGKKTGGKDFAKGWKGGPGQPPLPVEIRQIRSASKEELIATFTRFLGMTKEELTATLTSPAATILELALGSILTRAIKDGDPSRLSFVMDRVYGKVKEISPADEGDGFDEVLEMVPTSALLKAAK